MVAAIVTQPPAMSGRGRKLLPSPVAQHALDRGFASDLIFTPERAGEAIFLSSLRALQPKLCITAAYVNILPTKFLNILQTGTVNIHPSLLPLYRGAAPVQRVLQDGAKETGVSLAFTVRTKLPPNLTWYNLTSFAITLNELMSGLQEKLPPTDSRLRPDQRHLENGEYKMANVEKQRLEKRQRISRKLQEHRWKPRWFRREDENGTFRYVGGYWEAREKGKWDACPDIFGEFNKEIVQSTEGF